MDSEAASSLVERYVDLVASPTSDPAEIEALLDADYRFIEHPNLLNPTGSERDRAAALAGIPQGRVLLSSQRFTIHDHLAAPGGTLITRAGWEGELAIDVGTFVRGTRLRAVVAMFFEFRNGRILRQENFDCYGPPAPPRN